MRCRNLVTLLVTLLAIGLSAPSLASAATPLVTEAPVYLGTDAQYVEASSRWVVWHAGTDIKAYDRLTGSTRVVGPGSYPAVDGDRVVYKNAGSMVVKDLVTGSTWSKSAAYADDADISGDIVVWDNSFPWHIIQMWNLSTGDVRDVYPSFSQYQENPSIDGNIIVWQQGTDGLRGFDLATDTSLSLVAPLEGTGYPQISGDLVVYERGNGGDNNDIWAYRLSTHESFAVCTAPGCQSEPHTDGQLVAWADYRNEGEGTSGAQVFAETSCEAWSSQSA